MLFDVTGVYFSKFLVFVNYGVGGYRFCLCQYLCYGV